MSKFIALRGSKLLGLAVVLALGPIGYALSQANPHPADVQKQITALQHDNSTLKQTVAAQGKAIADLTKMANDLNTKALAMSINFNAHKHNSNGTCVTPSGDGCH